MPLKLKRRPGRPHWYIHGTIRGVSVRESTGVADHKAAEAIRARREWEIIQRSVFGAEATATFVAAAVSYLETGGERLYLKPIIARLGSVPLAISGALLFSFLGLTTINIYSQVGLITLVGLIAKNGGVDAPEVDVCFESFRLRGLPAAKKEKKPKE